MIRALLAVTEIAFIVQSMATQRAIAAKRRGEAFIFDVQYDISTGITDVQQQKFCNYCCEFSLGELCKQCGAPRD